MSEVLRDTKKSYMQKLQQQLMWIGLFRFLVFTVTIVCVFFLSFQTDVSILGITVTIFLGGLMFLLAYTQSRKLKFEHAIAEARLALDKVTQEQKAGLNSPWDNGEIWAKQDQKFSLFGQGQVFHRLNRSVTTAGKKELADWLSTQNISWLDWRKRRDAIRELFNQPEFIKDFQATTFIFPFGSGNSAVLLEYLLNKKKHPTTREAVSSYRYLVKLVCQQKFKHRYLQEIQDQIESNKSDFSKVIKPLATLDALQCLAWYSLSLEQPDWPELYISEDKILNEVEILHRNPYGYTFDNIPTGASPFPNHFESWELSLLFSGSAMERRD